MPREDVHGVMVVLELLEMGVLVTFHLVVFIFKLVSVLLGLVLQLLLGVGQWLWQ